MKSIPALILGLLAATATAADKPNVIVIMADDLGYGELSSYGATTFKTPNIDKLAAEGVRFTHGYCSASTCTPTRYSLLTGEYAFRKEGTGIAPPNGHLTIDPDTFDITDALLGKEEARKHRHAPLRPLQPRRRPRREKQRHQGAPRDRRETQGRAGRDHRIRPQPLTLSSLLKDAGYATACIGKWHLGLGDPKPDWNGELKPGPPELGFDYFFGNPGVNNDS